MKTLVELEKKINSELTTKINFSEIKHNQLYIGIDKEDLIDVILFLKTNKDTKFRQFSKLGKNGFIALDDIWTCLLRC